MAFFDDLKQQFRPIIEWKNLYFEDETLKHSNRISDINAEVQTEKVINMSYSYLQQLDTMRDAVEIGLGMGAGMGLGQSMAQAFHNTQMQSSFLADDSMEKLETLKKMVEAELMTKAEYSNKNQPQINQR
ncbi:MAG: hypothetical protein KAG26_01645 [Methylococcales bacterium]|nr:hypothetical protein [Methylococcales bacterium]